MATAALVARLALAAVFAVAGVAKLRDREGTRKAAVEFGAPEGSARALAVLIPVTELAVAVLLTPSSTVTAGAIGALGLLLVFTTAVAISLARGRAPDCHCFGQLHSAPASWKTLARNGALGAMAVLVLGTSLADDTPSAVSWIGDLDGPEIVALVVGVAAIVLLTVGTVAFMTLMRSYGNVLVRLDRLEAAVAEAGIDIDEPLEELGLEPGTPAPAFTATAVTGEQVTLETLTARELPSLLLFTSPRCGPCKTLLPSAVDWQRDHADLLTVAFASDASEGEARAEAEEFELETVLLDEDRRLYEAFGANGTPSAVLIAADGTIGSWLAAGADAIERLVARVTTETEELEGLPVGMDAPAIELPDLDGQLVSLAELRGREALLLFWNPDCGFCRAMHDDLVAWEAHGDGDTELVVVASGDAEATRGEGFRSKVLLDDEFGAGAAFHANGTPMAVLIDADGRIASSVVAGADAVLSLLAPRAVPS